MNGFKGQKIFRDAIFDSTTSINKNLIPNVPLPDLLNTPNKFPGEPGRIVYNPVGKSIHYSDGLEWLKLTPGSGGGSINGFMFGKNLDMLIQNNTTIPIDSWSISFSPSYSTIVGWDLGTGVFTASSEGYLMLDVSVTWSNSPNIGRRVLNIEYKQFPSPFYAIVKQIVIQPPGNNSISMSQMCSATLHLDVEDSVRVSVFQDSGTNLNILQGVVTTISGFFSET